MPLLKIAPGRESGCVARCSEATLSLVRTSTRSSDHRKSEGRRARFGQVFGVRFWPCLAVGFSGRKFGAGCRSKRWDADWDADLQLGVRSVGTSVGCAYVNAIGFLLGTGKYRECKVYRRARGICPSTPQTLQKPRCNGGWKVSAVAPYNTCNQPMILSGSRQSIST